MPRTAISCISHRPPSSLPDPPLPVLLVCGRLRFDRFSFAAPRRRLLETSLAEGRNISQQIAKGPARKVRYNAGRGVFPFLRIVRAEGPAVLPAKGNALVHRSRPPTLSFSSDTGPTGQPLLSPQSRKNRWPVGSNVQTKRTTGESAINQGDALRWKNGRPVGQRREGFFGSSD